MAVETWDVLVLGLKCLVTALAVLAGLVVFMVWRLHRKYAHIPGPPRASFLFGHTSNIAEAFKNGDFFSNTLLKWIQEYGHTIVIFIYTAPLVVTVDTEAVKKLMSITSYLKPEQVYGRSTYLYGARFLGRGLATDTDHEQWKRRRMLVDPAFHRKMLQSVMPKFNDATNRLMAKLLDVADGVTEVSMLDYFHRATVDVIGKAGFSMEINSINNIWSPFPQALAKVMNGYQKASSEPIKSNIPLLDWKYRSHVAESCQFLRDVAQEKVLERKNSILRGESVPQDILSFLVKAGDDPKISREEILDDFVTFFIGGGETSTNTLGFLVVELGKHPDIQDKVRREVLEVLGELNTDISLDDLNHLEYLTCVIKETMRLYPPITVTFRKTPDDHMLGGYVIPKDTTVVMSSYAAGRLEEYQPDALKFNPDRFLPDSKIKPPMYTYFPFALGHRSCIGQNFAMIELKLIIARFLQTFNFELDETQSFDIEETTTIHPKGGARVVLTPRHGCDIDSDYSSELNNNY